MCKSILDYSHYVLNNVLSATQYNNLVRFVTSVDDVFFREHSIVYGQCLKIESKNRSNSDIESSKPNPLSKKKILTIFNQDDEEGVLLDDPKKSAIEPLNSQTPEPA